MTRSQGIRQRALIYQRTPGAIHDAHPGLAVSKPLLIDEAARLRRQRSVEGDEIRLHKQLIQAHQVDLEFAHGILADVRVKGNDIHPETLCTLCDTGADATQTHNPQRLAIKLNADELTARPFALPYGFISLRHVPYHGKKQSQRVLGGGGGVGPRRVHHNHAVERCGINVHVVQSHASSSHNPESLG